MARRYDALQGEVGQRFICELSNDIRGVRARRWNVEWFIVSQTVILQHAPYVTASHSIRRQIGKLLDAWEARQNQMLVEETNPMCKKYLYKT